VNIDTKRAHVIAVCPFCKGVYTAGFVEGSTEEAVLVHTVPECDPFVRLEVLDFLERARLAGAVPIGGGPDQN